MVTLEPIVTDVNKIQSLNALVPNLVTLLIVVTLEPIIRVVKLDAVAPDNLDKVSSPITDTH